MKINKILINNLFELFDHEISVRTNERITILHGPNGVGKTTLLKLIHDLFSKKLESVCHTPFQKLMICFDNQTILTVEKNHFKTSSVPSIKLTLQKPLQKEKRHYEWAGGLQDFQSLLSLPFIENALEHREPVNAENGFVQNTSEKLSFSELIEQYWKFLESDFHKSAQNLPEWLREVLDSLPVYFIQTQRLFANSVSEEYEESTRRQTKSVVEKYAEDLAQKIREKQRQAGTLAASLDRTLPHRLLESQTVKSATEEQLREKYRAQTLYRQRLMAAGLIEEEEQIALAKGGMDETLAKILWYSLNDVDEKLHVFDDLLTRIELFKEIINSRFLYNTFSIDKSMGFVFLNKKGHQVPLDALSSGEQHELILVYELLFSVKEKSLILIDEPELSLHVTWQHQFLEDLTKISGLANIDFLIATHSPSIVHHRRDLMEGLGEAVAC